MNTHDAATISIDLGCWFGAASDNTRFAIERKNHALVIALYFLAALFIAPRTAFAYGNEPHSENPEPSASAVGANSFCPVLTDEPIDPAIEIEYQGKRVFFCCKNCRKNFLEDPAAYLPNLPQFAKANAEGQAVGPASAMGAERHEQNEEKDHEGASAPGASEHDHATGHGQPEGLGRAVRYVGKFHPLMVHFPIALVLVAALAELIGIRQKKNVYFDIAFFCLGVGALAAVVTVALGWATGAFAHYPAELVGIRVLTLHRWLGTGAGALVLVTFGLAYRARRRKSARLRTAYRATLFLSAALVSVAGHFGASLIYGLDYFFN